MQSLRTSRTWIGIRGKKRDRAVTLTLVLARAGRVAITVTQISPVCRPVGHFVIAGHAGVNRIRFGSRVGGERLSPGTYRISARTLGGDFVKRVLLVVVAGGVPSKAQLTAARAANACLGTRVMASVVSGTESLIPSAAPSGRASAAPAPVGENTHSGVLGTTVDKAARAIRPALVALLALAIVLLGLASLPKVAGEPRVNDLLVRHRLEIAGVGTAALVGVAAAFLFG